MAKLTKMAYFCSLRGIIDFENLLVLEKNAEKPYTRTKYFFFYLLSLKLGGIGNTHGGQIFK